MMADKREFKCFVETEFYKLEEYLRKMHKQGYEYETSSHYVYYFNKCESKDIVYKIVCKPRKVVEWDEFLQLYKDYGWECFKETEGYFYFRKDAEGVEPVDLEIFSDEESRKGMIKEVLVKRMIIAVGISLLWLYRWLHLSDALSGFIGNVWTILWGIILIEEVFYLFKLVKGVIDFKKWKPNG